MHYLIIVILIICILIWQFSIFSNNKKKLSVYKNIFPSHISQFSLIQLETSNFVQIETQHINYTLEVIISSINNYLIKNKGSVGDFHLMKDIVDRNCDAIEDDIHTQIPLPLYLGLVGTMFGILIGVGFLVGGGGINDILNSNSSYSAKGVEALLGGVALAMISSISGILLTTFGSVLTKNVKVEFEKNKNVFFSWLEAELLPSISKDTSSVIERMTTNLTNFNIVFSQNTEAFKKTLSYVNTSYEKQTELMQVIKRLKITDIAKANIDVYEKLKNSTNEIGIFGDYLKNANQYLADIQALHNKLDEYERRTQVIENAGKFFAKNEKWLAENFDIANLEVKAALDRFKVLIIDTITKLQESIDEQILEGSKSFAESQESFERAIAKQQEVLQGKLQETSKLVEELKNLTYIKEGIKDFKEATEKQNAIIENLAKEIRTLAEVKIVGGTLKQEISFPRWLRILIFSGGSLLIIVCLFYLVPRFTDWILNIVNILF